MGNLRDRILATDDSRSELVDVPEWDVKILVKSMDGTTRSKMIGEFVNVETGAIDYVKLYPTLVIACSFDPETGERIFTDADLDAVGAKNGAALETVAIVAARLCGLDQDAVGRAKRDFDSTPNAGTTSILPSDSGA